MAYVDPALVQQILDVSKRKREAHVHHDRQADDLLARLEVLERITFRHPETLPSPLPHRKPGCSDNANAGPASMQHVKAMRIRL